MIPGYPLSHYGVPEDRNGRIQTTHTLVGGHRPHGNKVQAASRRHPSRACRLRNLCHQDTRQQDICSRSKQWAGRVNPTASCIFFLARDYLAAACESI